MPELVVVVPSRGRPQQAAELAQAFRQTCTAQTELVFAVDANDPTLPEYQITLENVFVVENPSTMVHALNQAALAQSAYAIGFLGDDHRPRTLGWDAAYLTSLRAMGSGIVYGNDLLQSKDLPTQCAMTADVIKTLGFMAPPVLRHMYVDNFWRNLGIQAEFITYLPEVIVEHLHPVAGKAIWDEGYRRVNDPKVFDADEQAYRSYLATDFEQDLNRVKALRPSVEHEWQLFQPGTVPEYTKAEWYAGREHAPHLEQELHRDRLLTSAQLVKTAAFVNGCKTIVDLGAGDGGLLSLLKSYRSWGYDLMPENLAASKVRGVDVRFGDVVNDPIDWADVAIATEMLEHLVDPHGFVRTIREHAKVLIASSPWIERPGNAYEFHTWAWDLAGYRNLIEQAGFKVRKQVQVHSFQVVMAW